ncbi:MAG: MerR family DNA-binding transcriptional regulator [Thalassobaculaceae bacterium]
MTQLVRELGLTSRAIRFYEQQGLISPGRNGRSRVFSAGDRTRLVLIQRGRRLGFSIADIREILDLYDSTEGERAQLVHLLRKIRDRRAQLEAQRRDIEAIEAELAALENTCLDRLSEDAA